MNELAPIKLKKPKDSILSVMNEEINPVKP